MACRIQKQRFLEMAAEAMEVVRLTTSGLMEHDPAEPFCLAEVEDGVALLNRKAIQSLVDEPEQARPIIRNLLRWCKEHGAK